MSRFLLDSARLLAQNGKAHIQHEKYHKKTPIVGAWAYTACSRWIRISTVEPIVQVTCDKCRHRMQHG